MNDFWNDPPEEPELPGCPECDGDADYVRDGKDGQVMKCGECEHEWSLPFPVEPDPPDNLAHAKAHATADALATKPNQTPVNQNKDEETCPHGNLWGDCDACDFASDIAFDTARENRIFGR